MKTAALEPLPPALEKILYTLLGTTDITQYTKVISKIVILALFDRSVGHRDQGP